MRQELPFPIRVECPPGACVCRRDELLAAADGDTRILRLTREEEKKLIARIESVATYEELQRLGDKMLAQLGIAMRITPSPNEVRTVRGLNIEIGDLPGLCRKTRQAIPSAVRRCLDQRPEIVYAILNSHDLLG